MINLPSHFPRKALPPADKVRVWLKIQNHLRQERIQERQPGPAFPIFSFKKLAVATLLVLVIASIFGGVTKAAEGSLPGETLYTVKKAVEKVEVVLATSDEAKVKVLSKQAKRRLSEVATLVQEKKDAEVVTSTLEDLKLTTEQVIVAAIASTPELLPQAEELVAEATKVLSLVKDQAEEKVKQAVAEVIATSQESINKVKSESQEKVEGSMVEEETTPSTTAEETTGPKVQKPKIKDGLLESPLQIHDVIKLEGQSAEPEEPQILPQPSVGF